MSAKDFKDELTILQREPALITGVVVAVAGVLGAVGLQVDDSTTAAVSALIMSVIAFLGAVVIRSKVTPAAAVDKKQAEASAKAPTSVEESVTPVPEEVISAPAPEPEVEYDPEATVPGDGSDTEASSVVDSKVESDPLAAAVAEAQAADKAKEDALAKATQQVQDYSTKLADAQQKLAVIQPK